MDFHIFDRALYHCNFKNAKRQFGDRQILSVLLSDSALVKAFKAPKMRYTIISSAAIVAVIWVAGCENVLRTEASMNKKKTEAQVRRIAEDLDRRTTETGVYVRVKPGDVKDKDVWGTPVRIDYAQGGVAETVTVRSAGPDREFDTEDDIDAQCLATNMKGIGEGIKKNAEETAAKVAKGVVKGAIGGFKESIKEALPFKKKKVEAKPQEQEEAAPQKADGKNDK